MTIIKSKKDSSHKRPPVVIWGVHPVNELLRHYPFHCLRLYVLPSFGRKKHQAALLSLAEKQLVTPERTKDFHKIIEQGAVHQGVVAVTEAFWEIDSHDLTALCRNELSPPPLLLICDNLNDPQNIGAIARNCTAFGVKCLILPERNSPSINGTIIKASAGAIFHLKVCRVTNVARTIRNLKKGGIWIGGLASEGDRIIGRTDLDMPLALVTGSENQGLRPVIRKECDFILTIPINRIDSLNAASATAIALYEVRRQQTLQQPV
jgi:23S rRNA (guanosine2251-2'-O)-methyltransferase